MLDTSNAVHAQHFSALMTFALAGKPSKPIGGPLKDLAFFRSNDVVYGGPAFEIIYDPT
jgi:hypothetical protein